MERQRVKAIIINSFYQLRKEKEKIVGDWLE
jgi:hypothetical protein